MSVNISGVPSDTSEPTKGERIWIGKPAQIQNHPHQVGLLN
jgi:ribosomal protein S8E